MASQTYATIPADLESEVTLLNKPNKTKTSTKALVFGFAAAAFVLGAVRSIYSQPGDRDQTLLLLGHGHERSVEFEEHK